ncbi:MAG: aspartate kinase [Acidobacteria bacterium]|nr:aspartate kinase [Acidobacteriota bacterium]
MLVMKFGGTSVGDAQCFASVEEIIARAMRERPPVVVVVSAMSTVTETLLAAARLAAAGDEAAVREKLEYLERKHLQVVEELFTGSRRAEVRKAVEEILAEFQKLCAGVALLRELSMRAMDAGWSAGERLSATLLASYLTERGIPAQAVDAARCVVTDSNFGSARPRMDATQERLQQVVSPLAKSGSVPVLTGFLGATQEGIRTTLGRGASDYSAAIVAASLDADELCIWTDVDGVLSADPKVVGEALILEELTYEEAAELSHFGAKVLHRETLAPLVAHTIPVYIKNTFAPHKPGTRIGAMHEGSPLGPKAASSLAPVALLTLRSNGTPETTELLARTFEALSHSHVEILMVTQASYQNSFCLLVPHAATQAARAALERVFRLELSHQYLQPIESEDVAAVALIGEGMRGMPGIAGRLFGALGRAKINVIAIAQGSSESNISLVVALPDGPAAVEAIHREFIAPATAPRRQ